MRVRTILAAGALCAAPAAAQAESDLEMWRLDCGTISLSDSASFSDTHLYDGQPRTLTDSCYLIRNADRYLLWDTGMPAELAGGSQTSGVYTVSVKRTIADQLGDLGLTPADVDFVGISHYHFDHIGQLSDFGGSTLLIGEQDFEAVRNADAESGIDPRPFATWLTEDSPGTSGSNTDHDVFGDGSVVLLATPGHTPGHRALLVRLPETGPVLLTGDLYHFEEQVANRGVPQFNADRADTLASMARFDQMARNLDATVVIQHDQRHVDRLPQFPESAR